MKNLFPKVFTMNITLPSFIAYFVIAFIACAGINSVITLLGLSRSIELTLIIISTLYFGLSILLAFLNLIKVIRVDE